MIATIRDDEILDIDFDAILKQEQESWEIPQPYWVWKSAYGRVEEPTHWAPLPSLPNVKDQAPAISSEAPDQGRCAVAPGSAKSAYRTLRLEIEMVYDAEMMHGDDKDAEEWFFRSVLAPGDLCMHSNEIGDLVGVIRSAKILPNADVDASPPEKTL